MRTAPVPLACLGDDQAVADQAHAIAVLLQADPLAGESCVLWCAAIDRAIREGRLDVVGDGLARLPADCRIILASDARGGRGAAGERLHPAWPSPAGGRPA